jgi:hypothetical protein
MMRVPPFNYRLLIVGLTLLGLAVAFLDSIVWRPGRQRRAFVRLWTERLTGIHDPVALPEDWKNSVCLRKLNKNEWVLAAMHHGSCCNPEMPFNCSVFRGSDGKILVLSNWSPCAGTIDGMASAWEDEIPANSLQDLYLRSHAMENPSDSLQKP